MNSTKYCAAHHPTDPARMGARLRRSRHGADLTRFARKVFLDRGQRGATVDERGAKTIMSGTGRIACHHPESSSPNLTIDHGDQIMISPTSQRCAHVAIAFRAWGSCRHASRRVRGGGCAGMVQGRPAGSAGRQQGGRARSAACSAARSAAWSACSPACSASDRRQQAGAADSRAANGSQAGRLDQGRQQGQPRRRRRERPSANRRRC